MSHAALTEGTLPQSAGAVALLLTALCAMAAERRTDSLPSAGVNLLSPSRAPVSASEAEALIRLTVPLPKRIEIPAKVSVPTAAIRIVGPAGDEPPAKQARDELIALLHLEQLAGRGLFQAYPQLKAQGGCQCAQCAKEDRNLLEVRTVVAAWKRAQATLPDLTIFVLTSEETEESNPRILRELPPEVKLWHYHSLFTYHASERPMLRPYLAEAAKAGRWVGVCPSVTA